MARGKKLQETVEYNPCRVECSIALRYLLAVRRNDTEQVAYFESSGKSVRHIILDVRTYERGMIFGYIGKQSNEHGWINGMLSITEEIKSDIFNTIRIGQSVDRTYAVAISWCTGTTGGGSHPPVWDEPVRDYEEAARQGTLLLERQHNRTER